MAIQISAPWIGSNVRPIVDQFLQQYQQAQQQLTPLAGLPGAVPTLQVPPLTADQLSLISQLEAAGASSADLANARSMLSSLTSGPIGSSPATQAGMQAWRQQVAPEVEQAAALAGLAGGGALPGALAQSETQAYLPLVQQEIQNREQAVGQYGGLAREQINNLASALSAAGMPYEQAAAQAQAAYNAAMQKLGITAGLQTGALGAVTPLFGQSNWQPSAPTGMDYASAIGGFVSPALGSLLGGMSQRGGGGGGSSGGGLGAGSLSGLSGLIGLFGTAG